MKSVLCITATCGRCYLMRRTLTNFINQDYKGPHTLLIYNNAHIPYSLDIPKDLPKEKTIILINNNISKETGNPYSNLGEIYRDVLHYIPETDLITFMDDDDQYIPNHITEGINGYLRAKLQKKIAYKPKYSYFKYDGKISVTENTLEPSIFVESSHIKEWGFSDKTTEQHLQWVDPLVKENKILVDAYGKPTLIYDWSSPTPTFKTSGDPNNPENFNNYRNFSKDFGDGILSPLSKKEMEKYESSSLYQL